MLHRWGKHHHLFVETLYCTLFPRVLWCHQIGGDIHQSLERLFLYDKRDGTNWDNTEREIPVLSLHPELLYVTCIMTIKGWLWQAIGLLSRLCWMSIWIREAECWDLSPSCPTNTSQNKHPFEHWQSPISGDATVFKQPFTTPKWKDSNKQYKSKVNKDTTVNRRNRVLASCCYSDAYWGMTLWWASWEVQTLAV